MSGSYKKKIWLDLVNSPHVPFFKPIIEELNGRGYEVILTARDCFQVCELADLFNLHFKRIGRHYGKNKVLKVVGMFIRALQLMPTLMREKPDLALSHGSREQLPLSLMLGIPSVLITDYEHSQFLPIIKPNCLIVPEVIPDDEIENISKCIIKYPGIKEDIYIPYFNPNPRIKDELGLNGRDLIVTVRPPATDAHYHSHQSQELFEAVIEYLCHRQNLCIVLLPRDNKQSFSIQKLWSRWFANGKIIIPKQVVDGLNLIWHSDLVISGGGTMNREAAALGVPVYSVFRGEIPAVDKYLSARGRLTHLESVEDVHTKIVLERRHQQSRDEHRNSTALHRIVDSIVTVLES